MHNRSLVVVLTIKPTTTKRKYTKS